MDNTFSTSSDHDHLGRSVSDVSREQPTTTTTTTTTTTSHHTVYPHTASSSQQSVYHRPSTGYRTCMAHGCPNLVYYDPSFGPFDYCSPGCRDVHFLPEYNKKLEKDIAEFHQDCSVHASVIGVSCTNLENLRKMDISIVNPSEGFGLLLVDDEETNKIYVSGARTTQGIELFKARQIFLNDRVVEVCGKQVKTKAEVKEMVKDKKDISLTLDNYDSFTVLLKDFCESALLDKATHLVCIRHKTKDKKYGIIMTNNLTVDSTAKGSEARRIGLQTNYKILCYSSISCDTLYETVIPRSKNSCEEDIKAAYSKGRHLLLALGPV